MNRRITALALVSLLSIAGCATDAGSPSTTASLLSECSAPYRCTYKEAGVIADSALMRADSGECTLRGNILSEDGLLRDMFKAEIGSWTATATSIEVCQQGRECYRCERIDAPGDVPSTGAHCTGTPSSCSSNSPGSCSSIRGCYMRTRVRYNGTYDNYCDGTPYSCESMGSESACREQGCDWK